MSSTIHEDFVKLGLLAYMAINIDFDDNKPHVLIKQMLMNCAFKIRKWCYGIKVFWTKIKVF